MGEKAAKERLDVLLVNAGLVSSRELAKRHIMAGEVFVNGQREDKPGSFFAVEDLKLELRADTLRYVSRGGLKLEKALQVFPIDLKGSVCMDITMAELMIHISQAGFYIRDLIFPACFR